MGLRDIAAEIAALIKWKEPMVFTLGNGKKNASKVYYSY
jgi:hypothetical protein